MDNGTRMNGAPVPGNLREVTASWLTGALAPGGAPGDGAFRDAARVTGFTAESIGGEMGFMSDLYRLWLEYDGERANLPRTAILKLPSADPLMRTYFDRMGQNLREVLFYQRGENGEHLQIPRGYYCVGDPATGNSALLLEDLSDAMQGDSVAGCSMPQARMAMEKLAKFHAAWWGAPALDALDWLPPKDAETAFYEKLYEDSWRLFIEKARDGMPPGLRELGDRLGGLVAPIKARLSRHPQTFLHGDFRLDNCFFPNEEGTRPFMVIDWEFCVRGRGAYDVATFVSEAYPVEQRRAVEMGLLRTYHSTLEANGVSDYSFEECVEDYRLSMLEVVVFWIVGGGYCDYEGDRATAYLHNSLARFHTAIEDLKSMELLQG